MRRCVRDGSEHYPRTDPAVIMSVTDPDDRLLLGRGAHWPEGRFSVLAGFVEPGESFEAAVAREVAEEVGIRIDDARYLGNQPWPFPSSLMVGYAATTSETDLRPDPTEIAEARWVTRERVSEPVVQQHDSHPERHLDRQAPHRALAGRDRRVGGRSRRSSTAEAPPPRRRWGGQALSRASTSPSEGLVAAEPSGKRTVGTVRLPPLTDST